jgi:hypothetical protein
MPRHLRFTAWLVTALVLSASTAFSAARPLEAPLGRSQADLEMENFLRSAEIVDSVDVGEGITKPVRLTLRLDGVEHRGIFKTVDEEIDELSFTKTLEPHFTDRYVYEVAAYYVDRLFGIGLVPVTVLRTVDGQQGSLQLWIEDITTMDRALEIHGETPVEHFDLLLERMMLTYILDALIYNTDRNQGNILVDFGNDRFFPIDHSRAFRLHKKLPPMRDTEIPVPEDVDRRLHNLELDTLQTALDELLETSQIKAIDKRRRLLIKDFEKRGLM